MYCQNCGSTEHFTELCFRPKQKPHDSRFWLAVFALMFFIMGPSNAFNLTDEERVDCEKEGGCQVFTRVKFEAILNEVAAMAFNKGKKSCNSSI